MNQIALIPSQMPQHIAQSRRDLAMNDAAMANWGARFATVSFKGKRWAVRYRGEETVIQRSPGFDANRNPLPVMAITAFPVIIVGIAPHLAKTYYAKGYTDGDENAPDCFSVDSIKPDPASPKIQCETCAACPQNRFGSAITETGSKAKACRDVRRVAVVPADDVANEEYGGPMMMRLPAMSIPNLLTYAAQLKSHGLSIGEVVTVMTFDTDAAYPAVEFQASKFVEDPDDYQVAGRHATSELVRLMLFDAVTEAAPDNQPTPTVAPAITAANRPAHIVQNPQLAPATPVTSVTLAAVGRPTPTLVPPPAAAAPPTAPPAAPAAPAEPPDTVVRGAPADMEQQIDDLLSTH